jgi:hypothetical protein
MEVFMLKQYVPRSDRSPILHEPGEIVRANYGNFLEQGRGRWDRKPRPAILLRTSDCQHAFAGLTLKPTYKTTGDARLVVPKSPIMGLDHRRSHLWSLRVNYVSRIDVMEHLGWVDHELVDFLGRTMELDGYTLGLLWQAATLHACASPNLPR